MMEPKDLKNSNEELETTPQELEPVEVQEVQEDAEEIQITEEPVEEVPTSEPEATEEVSEATEEVAAEVEEPVAVEEIPEESVQISVVEESEEELGDEPVLEEIEQILETPVLQVEEKPKREPVDYSSKTEVELINALKKLLAEGHDYDDIHEDVENIRFHFYRQHQAATAEKKKAFQEANGEEAEFIAEESPYENDLRNLLDQFRSLRTEHNKKLEEEKEANLVIKYQIIEEIKDLVNRKESINKTFQEFRELQNRWRDTGLVPQAKLKDLWETYHHHVENFYDYIKINKELRDLDLKKNLEAKLSLCEKAEELLVEPSIIRAFNILQKYHEQWREIGPVPRDKKDELWERFKAATSKINKKHQDYFEDRKSEQKNNLDAKTLLCEKAEEINTAELLTHKDWDDKSRELVELQKVWRTVGFAPKKDNNRIYERFRNACDAFFNAKRDFYSQNKEVQQTNLQMKMELCLQAESLRESTDWKKTTDDLIELQRKWKDVGPVSRKQSEAIWKRFRAACDYFFEHKSKHFSSIDTEQEENLRQKQELIETVKAFKLGQDEEDSDIEKLKEFQRRFTEIGHVPFKEKDRIQNEFREAINAQFDSLRVDDKKRNLMSFKSKMNNMNTGRSSGKMRYEREKYVSKLKQLETDLALLDNNIGFFANTKNAESLIGDVNQKIVSTKEKIEFLKEKIRILDEMDDENE